LKLSDLQAHFKMEKVKQAEFVKTIFIWLNILTWKSFEVEASIPEVLMSDDLQTTDSRPLL
jgi:hypothetical protein